MAWLSIGISAWSFSKHFEGGVTQEFCQYAEIGRNILEGRGLRTAAVFPFTLAYLDGRGIPFDPHHFAPVLDRFPLQAFLTAGAEAVFGKTDRAAGALSTFLLALCVMATCAVGWNIFGPAEGMLAALFLAFNPSFQRGFVLWGLPDFGFCLLTLCAMFMASRPASSGTRPKTVHFFWTGTVAGLAWLARSNFILWLPLFFWVLAFPKEGKAWRWGAFIAGFVLASCPGWIYNLRWYGAVTPPTFAWNLAHHVVQDAYPLSSYKTFSVGDSVMHHFPALWRKFWRYLYLYLRDFPSLWQMHILFPLMILGFYAVEKSDPPERRFFRLATAMLAVEILVFSALRYERLGTYVAGRYILWWAPVALLLAAHGIVDLSKRSDYPKIVPGMLIAAAIAWYFPYLTAPQGQAAHPSKLPIDKWPEIAMAAEIADPMGLIVTNLPAQMAWYGSRNAVGLPSDPSDLLAIEQRHQVAAVLISRLKIGELEQAPAWQALLADPAQFKAYLKKAGLKVTSDVGTAILLRPVERSRVRTR